MANTLEIKIWSTTDPKPTTVVGGGISSTNNGDGTWTLSSTENITHFKHLSNSSDITKIDVINATTLVSLEDSFRGLTNLVDFTWAGSCIATNFNHTFEGCTKLVYVHIIPMEQALTATGMFKNCTSLFGVGEVIAPKATDVSEMFSGCTSLKAIGKMDFSSITNGTDAFLDTTHLDYPGDCCVPIRKGNDATATVLDYYRKDFFNMLVESTEDPVPETVGGPITSVMESPNKWRLTSHYAIKSFRFSEQSITRIIVFTCWYVNEFDYAFAGLKSLTNLHLEDRAIMGDYSSFSHAFEGCTNFTGITTNRDGHISATNLDYAFAGTSVTTCRVPDYSCKSYVGTWKGCKNLTSIGEILYSRDDELNLSHAWEGCTNLVEFKKINVPLLKPENGKDTFKGCTSLTSPAPDDDVRSGDDLVAGFFPEIKQDTLLIELFPFSDINWVNPKDTEGGELMITQVEPQKVIISSSDNITKLGNLQLKKANTDHIRVVKGATLLDISHAFMSPFGGCTLEWVGECNVENFDNAFYGIEKFINVDFSKGKTFRETWSYMEGDAPILDQLDLSSLEDGTDAFKGSGISIPPATGTPVRDGDNAIRGVLSTKLVIKFHAYSDPIPLTVEGGTITSAESGRGVWILSSYDNITHFKDLSNKNNIYGIEVIKGDTLTSLEDSFSQLYSMTDFTWHGDCNVTDFTGAWRSCSKLTSFPQIDTSKGTNFTQAWSNCSYLRSISLVCAKAGRSRGGM